MKEDDQQRGWFPGLLCVCWGSEGWSGGSAIALLLWLWPGMPWPEGCVISMQSELEIEVLQICSCYLPLPVAQGDNSGEWNCAPEFSVTRIY